jgi:hypothetical protein
MSGETKLKMSFVGLFAKAVLFLSAGIETIQGMKTVTNRKHITQEKSKNQFALLKRTIRAV